MSRNKANETTVSVIIPTLNRPEYLINILHSILRQSEPPIETIVVDQSDNSDTKELVSRESCAFVEKRISLEYIWTEVKSISHARNLGVRAATGNIVVYLDDDMIAHRHYIREILRVFKNNPSALGVQGLLFPPPYWEGFSTKARFVNAFRRAFLLTHWEKNNQKILLSGDTVVAYPVDKTIRAALIFPATSAFKKEIILQVPQDEKLKGYSWGEERATVRISESHPNSLFVTPLATAFHDYASHGRPKGKKFYYVTAEYELYSFGVNFRPSFKNWVAFFWKWFGKILLALPDLRSKDLRMRLLYTLGSYSWALRNFNDVRNGRFSF